MKPPKRITHKADTYILKRVLIVFLISIVLARISMVVAKQYQAPKQGLQATLTFRNESDMQARIFVYTDGLHCKNRRTIAFDQSKGMGKINISATAKFAFQYALFKGGTGHCIYTISFTPTPNDNYLVYARTSKRGKAPMKCHLFLVRVHPEGIISRVDFEIRTPKQAIADKSAHCLPISETQKRRFTDE